MYWKPPFRKSTKSHGKDYPEVTVSYEFVDAVAMRWYNGLIPMMYYRKFGDILTDEASVISDLWD
jgi:3-isopropylmalate dehydrogenase